jgi:sulfur relay protein TusB/DsrH
MLKVDVTETLVTQGPIYVLNEDVEARGLKIENDLYQGVSYPEFVALALKCKQVISW